MGYQQMMRGRARKILFGLWVLGVGLAVSRADVVTLEAVADTSLFEFNPEFNFGAQSDVPSGTLGGMAGLAKSRMLAKFDIAGALPAGAVIMSAVLRLNVVVSPSGRANSVFGVHRVELDWGEGNKSGAEPGGAPASAGEATWNSRFHPTVEWDDPGGDLGTDFANESSGQAQVFHLGSYEFVMNPKGIADIELMASDPAKNYGWAIVSQSEGTAKTARRWATRENSNPSIRPKLEIEYEIPEPPPTPEILALEIEEASVRIRIIAHPGIHYSLESADELDGMVWSSVGEISGGIDPGEVEFVVPREDGMRRFLRVVASFAN